MIHEYPSLPPRLVIATLTESDVAMLAMAAQRDVEYLGLDDEDDQP